MSEAGMLVPSLIVGVCLGTFFFGGLWWTVRYGVCSKRPGFWFLGSLLLRMGIALVGFYFASNGDWKRMLFCLLGFVIARFATTWLTRPSKQQMFPKLEAKIAPHP